MDQNTPAEVYSANDGTPIRPVFGLDEEDHEAARHHLSLKSYRFVMSELLDYGYLTTDDIENRSARYSDIMDDNYHGRYSTTGEDLKNYAREFTALDEHLFTMPEGLRPYVDVDVQGLVQDMALNGDLLVIVEPVGTEPRRKAAYAEWDCATPAYIHIFQHCESFE